jgi:hypothetical protein
MIQVIHCRKCGESEIKGAAAHVNFIQHSFCGECHHGHDRRMDLYFCSAKCMVEYVREHGDKVIAAVEEFQDNENWPYVERYGKYVNLMDEGGLPQKQPEYKPVVRHGRKKE